jgi:hypothetical protein
MFDGVNSGRLSDQERSLHSKCLVKGTSAAADRGDSDGFALFLVWRVGGKPSLHAAVAAAGPAERAARKRTCASGR